MPITTTTTCHLDHPPPLLMPVQVLQLRGHQQGGTRPTGHSHRRPWAVLHSVGSSTVPSLARLRGRAVAEHAQWRIARRADAAVRQPHLRRCLCHRSGRQVAAVRVALGLCGLRHCSHHRSTPVPSTVTLKVRSLPSSLSSDPPLRVHHFTAQPLARAWPAMTPCVVGGHRRYGDAERLNEHSWRQTICLS